jgi:hypothetical protein
MDTSLPTAFPEYVLSRALHDALVSEAVCAADRVAAFLHVFCREFERFHPDVCMADRWKSFPANFYLNLAAALMIGDWEREGQIKPEFCLATATDCLSGVMLGMSERGKEPLLFRQVLQIFVHFFAWSARKEIGGAVALNLLSADEDDLADKIASFLWDHRHDLE